MKTLVRIVLLGLLLVTGCPYKRAKKETSSGVDWKTHQQLHEELHEKIAANPEHKDALYESYSSKLRQLEPVSLVGKVLLKITGKRAVLHKEWKCRLEPVAVVKGELCYRLVVAGQARSGSGLQEVKVKLTDKDGMSLKSLLPCELAIVSRNPKEPVRFRATAQTVIPLSIAKRIHKVEIFLRGVGPEFRPGCVALR